NCQRPKTGAMMAPPRAFRRNAMTMTYETVRKPATLRVPPNLKDYDEARRTFRWEDANKELDGLPGGGLNLAYEAIDRHATGARRDKEALLWEGKNGEEERYTFAQMAELSNKFANVLTGLGVKKCDRVFVFAERFPELYYV